MQSVFDDKHKADLETYVRSHIPFREYHKDPENDHYDAARHHIDEMGILTDRKSDDQRDS